MSAAAAVVFVFGMAYVGVLNTSVFVILPMLFGLFVVPMLVGMWLGVLARHLVFRWVMSN